MATTAGVSFTIDASGATKGASEIAAAIAKIESALGSVETSAKTTQTRLNASFKVTGITQAIEQIKLLGLALQSIKAPTGLTGIATAMRTMQAEFSALTAVVRGLSTAMNAVNSTSFVGHVNAASQATRDLGAQSNGTMTILKSFAAVFAIGAIQKFGEGIYSASTKFGNFKATMLAVSPTVKEANAEMSLILNTVYKLGLDLATTTDSFAKFYASAHIAGASTSDINEIFVDLSKAMTVFGLSVSKQQYVWIALEQMFNKGSVQAEELKRQLGNELPAAFELMAKAVGVSQQELIKMMKAGEVGSDNVVKLARVYIKEFGAGLPTALEQARVGVGRFNTAWTVFLAGIGGSGAMKQLNVSLSALSDSMLKFKASGELDEKNGLPQLSDEWQAAADNIASAMKNLLTISTQVFGFLARNAEAVGIAIEIYLGVKAITFLKNFGLELIGVGRYMLDFAKGFLGMQAVMSGSGAAAWGATFANLATKIGSVVIAIARWSVTDLAQGKWAAAFDAFGKSAGTALANASRYVVSFIQAHGAVGTLKAIWTGLVNVISGSVVGGFNALKSAVIFTADALVSITSKAMAFMAAQGVAGVARLIGGGFVAMGAGIMAATRAAWAFARTPIGAVVTAIVVAVTVLVAVFGDDLVPAIQLVWQAMKNAVSGFVDWLYNIPLIGAAIQWLVENLVGYTRESDAAAEATRLETEEKKKAEEASKGAGAAAGSHADALDRVASASSGAAAGTKEAATEAEKLAKAEQRAEEKARQLAINGPSAFKQMATAAKEAAAEAKRVGDEMQRTADKSLAAAQKFLQALGAASQPDRSANPSGPPGYHSWAEYDAVQEYRASQPSWDEIRQQTPQKPIYNDPYANPHPQQYDSNGQPIMGRAAGGPVGNGMYLVGEQGPEILISKNPGYVLTNEQTKKMLHRAGGGYVPPGTPTMVGENGMEAFMGGQFSYDRSGYQVGDDAGSSSSGKSNDMAIRPRASSLVIPMGSKDISHYAAQYQKDVLGPSIKLHQVTKDQATVIMAALNTVATDWKNFKSGGARSQRGIATGTNGMYPYFGNLRNMESMYPYVADFVGAAYGSGLAGDISDPFSTTMLDAQKEARMVAKAAATPEGRVDRLIKELTDGTFAGDSKAHSYEFTKDFTKTNWEALISGLTSSGKYKVDMNTRTNKISLMSVAPETAFVGLGGKNNQTGYHSPLLGGGDMMMDLPSGLQDAVQMMNPTGVNMAGYVPEDQQAYDSRMDAWKAKRDADAAARQAQYERTIAEAQENHQKAMARNAATVANNQYHSANDTHYGGGVTGYTNQYGQRILTGEGGSLTGYATGGDFMVGGNGGVDSQYVNFRASPGEHVKVSKASHVRHGDHGESDSDGGRSGPPIQINIHGVSDFNSFRRSEKQMMGRLSKALSQARKGS